MRTPNSSKFVVDLRKALEKSPVRDITKDLLEKGGPGSGHYGHAGRPGEVGGSVAGGVAVGRAESPEADEHFKFSGKGQLTRPVGSPVRVEISQSPGGKNFEIHGVTDKNGNIVRGKCKLRVGGTDVEIDHDELHALRSKIRYMHMTNTRDVKTIAGKEIVRGQSMEVSVGGKKVSIPVNADTVGMFNEATKKAYDDGLSFTGESKRTVREAVRAMAGRSPISVVKERGFSKGGQYAAFVAHSNALTEKKMRAAVEGKKDPKARKMLEKTMKSIARHRTEGHEHRKAMSGTQSVKSYKKAAAYMTIFMRRM